MSTSQALESCMVVLIKILKLFERIFFVTLYLCLFSAFWFNRQLFETGLYLQKGNLYFPVYICTKFSVVLQFLINARKIFFMSKLISFSIEIDQSKNSFKLTYVQYVLIFELQLQTYTSLTFGEQFGGVFRLASGIESFVKAP